MERGLVMRSGSTGPWKLQRSRAVSSEMRSERQERAGGRAARSLFPYGHAVTCGRSGPQHFSTFRSFNPARVNILDIPPSTSPRHATRPPHPRLIAIAVAYCCRPNPY